MTPDIFLSYTREDQVTAQRFAEAFESQGYSVSWDVTLRSGEAYDQVTEEALRTARAVVVLWSKKSVASRWVRAEATLADRNRTLVPARIEACDLPIMFELTQTADLSHWKGAASDPAWRAFLADVRRFVEAGVQPQARAPQPSTEAPPASLKRRTLPSIAVLPFINRSGAEDDNDFAEGFVEDLTATLSVSWFTYWLKVVTASTSSIYRRGPRDLRQIGRDLGVRYLLEGSLRRVGEKLRVSAQLVEAENGSILWTERFDRPITELAALQEDLVAELAAQIGAHVQRFEMEHVLRKPGDITAWEAGMRAMAHYLRATTSGWEAAVAESRRAIEIDPYFADGYSSLASILSRLFRLRGGDDPELAREITDSIRRARELDPENPSVLIGLAVASASLWKLQDALPFAERAVSLSPNQDSAHFALGSVLVRLGRLDEGLAELEAASRQAPNSSLAALAALWRSIAHVRAERLDAALEAADRAIRILPGTETLVQGMLCLARADRWDRARDMLRRLRETDPGISCANTEGLVRDFYCGSDAAETNVATLRQLWDETPGEAPPA
jgi:TolB-like protein